MVQSSKDTDKSLSCLNSVLPSYLPAVWTQALWLGNSAGAQGHSPSHPPPPPPVNSGKPNNASATQVNLLLTSVHVYLYGTI